MDHKINSVGVVLHLKMIYRIYWETPMGYWISRYSSAPGCTAGYLRETPTEYKIVTNKHEQGDYESGNLVNERMMLKQIHLKSLYSVAKKQLQLLFHC